MWAKKHFLNLLLEFIFPSTILFKACAAWSPHVHYHYRVIIITTASTLPPLESSLNKERILTLSHRFFLKSGVEHRHPKHYVVHILHCIKQGVSEGQSVLPLEKQQVFCSLLSRNFQGAQCALLYSKTAHMILYTTFAHARAAHSKNTPFFLHPKLHFFNTIKTHF